MTAANESSALRTGFKIGNKAIADNAAIAMTKFGTRTLEIPICGGEWVLSGSGVALAEDGIFEGITMPDANQGDLYSSLHYPAEFDANNTDIDVEIYWKANDTGGDAKFTVAIGIGEDDDALAEADSDSVITTVQNVANKINKSVVTLSAAGLAADHLLGVKITRDPTDGDDDLGSDLVIVGVIIKFTGQG